MSYMYRAKPGEKGYWKGLIYTNNGNGKAKQFRSEEKLEEHKNAWYELVSEEEAPSKKEGGNSDESSQEQADSGIDPNAIADAFIELDHANDDHWNKDGTPKLPELNKHYQGQGSIKKADLEPLGLKRKPQDEQ